MLFQKVMIFQSPISQLKSGVSDLGQVILFNLQSTQNDPIHLVIREYSSAVISASGTTEDRSSPKMVGINVCNLISLKKKKNAGRNDKFKHPHKFSHVRKSHHPHHPPRHTVGVWQDLLNVEYETKNKLHIDTKDEQQNKWTALISTMLLTKSCSRRELG